MNKESRARKRDDQHDISIPLFLEINDVINLFLDLNDDSDFG